MDISRFVFNTKAIVIFCIFASGAIVVRSALVPAAIVTLFDQKIPVDMQEKLKRFIVEQAGLRPLRADQFYRAVHEQCPSVRAVSVHSKGSQTAIVSISALKPRVCLVSEEPGKKEWILCHEGMLVEKRFFSDIVSDGIDTMRIQGLNYDEKIADPELMQCVLAMRRVLFNEFTITWRSKVEIILQSKLSNSTIIADTSTILDGEKFEYVDRIFQSDPERYKMGIKADIRLKDEIICSPY